MNTSNNHTTPAPAPNERENAGAGILTWSLILFLASWWLLVGGFALRLAERRRRLGRARTTTAARRGAAAGPEDGPGDGPGGAPASAFFRLTGRLTEGYHLNDNRRYNAKSTGLDSSGFSCA